VLCCDVSAGCAWFVAWGYSHRHICTHTHTYLHKHPASAPPPPLLRACRRYAEEAAHAGHAAAKMAFERMSKEHLEQQEVLIALRSQVEKHKQEVGAGGACPVAHPRSPRGCVRLCVWDGEHEGSIAGLPPGFIHNTLSCCARAHTLMPAHTHTHTHTHIRIHTLPCRARRCAARSRRWR